MERLTTNYPDGTIQAIGTLDEIAFRLAAYEDTGMEPEEIKRLIETNETHMRKHTEMWKDLEKYLKAESEGRLLILPKTLYEPDHTPLITGVTEWKVTGARYYDGNVQAYTVRTENVQSIIYGREIGKTVFLTRAEAEAALRGGVDG